ncbi:MAG: FAD-dependent oxidoreductase [Pseudomonadales bacterium]
MSKSQKAVLAFVICVFGAAWFFNLPQYLNLDYFNSIKAQLIQFVDQQFLLAFMAYFLLYVAVAALSLPGAAIMTVAAGALFGLSAGVLLVSFASSIGATCAFLIARTLLKDWVQGRFGDKLAAINSGIEREGGFYLFGLRLVPVFPFFVINLVMGLSPMPVLRFYWVSQLGMLVGTIVYVNAGTQLAQVDQLGDFLSPSLIISFVLLGVFPLLAKKLLDSWRRSRVLRQFDKPKTFDTNLIVIGAGSGGLVSALIAATVKAKVTLIEKHKMGGDCLNTGCVPSKALIRAASIKHNIDTASDFGISASGSVDFRAVMARVQGVIKTIEPHDSVERFTGLGVDCIQGEARLLSPWAVSVNGQTITARNIILASGARPLVPPFPGLELVPWSSSDTVWNLSELPARLLVLGAGPIGCELAQAFSRLGSAVTQIDMADRILPREDVDVSVFMAEQFRQQGITVLTSHKVAGFEVGEEPVLIAEFEGASVRLPFDHVLVAIGRKANVEDMGLEQLGVELSAQGTVAVDAYGRTSVPTIYACGDVVGPYQFTHMASHQAWYAAVNALFGRFRKFAIDYSVVPWCTFTDPDVARVGLSEIDAADRGIAFEVTRYDLEEHDRAIADGQARGFVKVLTKSGSDKILGATIVGAHAGELIGEFVLAMKHGLGLNKILGTIHVYPTWMEANKFAAGNWRKARAPEKALNFAEKFHRWQRK